VEIPPLRERIGDLPLLIHSLLERQTELRALAVVNVSQEATDALARYGWPGNVRELSNLLERLSILYPQKTVYLQDLPERYRRGADSAHDTSRIDAAAAAQASPASIAADRPAILHDEQALPPGGLNLKDHLSRMEVTLIREALLEADGGVAGAARLLQMRRTTLVEKIRKYRLNLPHA
jgi:sigma-54 specific flagellar transcriptional regulator A